VRNRPAQPRGGRSRTGGGLPRLVALLLLSEAIGIALGATASAGSIPREHGLAMLVSPTRLTVASGQLTRTQRLQIQNRGSVPLDVSTKVEALTQRSNGSSLPQNAPWSATSWLTVTPDHFLVKPGHRQWVQVRIQLPARPEPGDHDLALIFMVPPRPGHGNIHIAEGIGVPVLITVPGQVTDDVSVTGLHLPGFSAGGAVPLTATVHEAGNVHHSFRGTGHQLEARSGSATVMFPPVTVLRESTVTMHTQWDHPPALCVCHVAVTVTSDGHVSEATATVVIFPVVPVSSTVGAILVLLAAFLLVRRHHRRRVSEAFQAGRGAGGLNPHPRP
jgi:hypothetical protein